MVLIALAELYKCLCGNGQLFLISPEVRPNQIWQDHRPRNYYQSVRVVLTLSYLIGFNISKM